MAETAVGELIEAIAEQRRAHFLSLSEVPPDKRVAELHALGLSRRQIAKVMAYYEGYAMSEGRVRGCLVRQGLATRRRQANEDPIAHNGNAPISGRQ